MNRHTPDLHLTAAMEFQGWVIGIGRFQPQPTAMVGETFEGEGSVEDGHHYTPRSWFEAAIHDKQIAVMNAGIDHRLATDAQKEGAGGMADELFVQVDPHLHVVIGGGGKSCGDPFTSQWQKTSGAPGLQGQQWLALPVVHTSFWNSTNEL